MLYNATVRSRDDVLHYDIGLGRDGANIRAKREKIPLKRDRADDKSGNDADGEHDSEKKEQDNDDDAEEDDDDASCFHSGIFLFGR